MHYFLAAVLVASGLFAAAPFTVDARSSARAASLVAGSSCGSWRPVWSPNPSAGTNAFMDVAVESPTKAIAVGGRTGAHGGATLAERWDGTRWRTLTPLDPGAIGNGFRAITFLADGSALAAGSRLDTTDPIEPRQPYRTLVERMSAGQWEVLPTPNRGFASTLVGIDSLGDHRAWAVGDWTASDSGGDPFRPLIMAWDGSDWEIVHSPSFIGGLNDIEMVSRRLGWAVGSSYNGILIQSWDGTSWSNVPGIVRPGGLSAIAARSGTDALAVGSGGSHSLVMRWDGRSWSRLLTPRVGKSSRLEDVTYLDDGSAYAVGGYERADGEARPLVLRWDGATWTRMRLSTASRSPMLSGVGASGPSDVHTVGQRRRHGEISTFAVHCTP